MLRNDATTRSQLYSKPRQRAALLVVRNDHFDYLSTFTLELDLDRVPNTTEAVKKTSVESYSITQHDIQRSVNKKKLGQLRPSATNDHQYNFEAPSSPNLLSRSVHIPLPELSPKKSNRCFFDI